MAKRKPKFKDKPHVMDPEVKKRFQELIEIGQGKMRDPKPMNPKWQLWRWDTLEDASQDI